MADDVGMVERIYARAGLDLTTPRRRGQLDAFMADNPRGKHGRHRVRPRAATSASIPTRSASRFAYYFDRFPVPAEDT